MCVSITTNIDESQVPSPESKALTPCTYKDNNLNIDDELIQTTLRLHLIKDIFP